MIAALAAAALASTSAPTEQARQLADLQHMYQQSCEIRAYGSFDDLCDQLKRQMREAEKAHRNAVRTQSRATPKPQPAAIAPPARD